MSGKRTSRKQRGRWNRETVVYDWRVAAGIEFGRMAQGWLPVGHTALQSGWEIMWYVDSSAMTADTSKPQEQVAC